MIAYPIEMKLCILTILCFEICGLASCMSADDDVSRRTRESTCEVDLAEYRKVSQELYKLSAKWAKEISALAETDEQVVAAQKALSKFGKQLIKERDAFVASTGPEGAQLVSSIERLVKQEFDLRVRVAGADESERARLSAELQGVQDERARVLLKVFEVIRRNRKPTKMAAENERVLEARKRFIAEVTGRSPERVRELFTKVEKLREEQKVLYEKLSEQKCLK